MTAVVERVAAGVAWLDGHEPGWAERIDLATFDITSPCRCVLGQVYAEAAEIEWGDGYHFGVVYLEIPPWPLGFSLPFGNWDGYPALEAEWVRVITQRRAAP